MARKLTRRRTAAAVLLLMLTGFGCNPLMFPYYLLGGLKNAKIQSQFDFYEKARAAKDKKELKIVIVPYRSRTLAAETIGAERTLTGLFINALAANFQFNREKVTIVSAADVEKFKRQHEDWKSMEPAAIARHFEADYAVEMELSEMSFYEAGSRDLYSGHCTIGIRIRDVDSNATELFPPYDHETTYPRGEVIPASEMSLERFQQKFLAKVATELAGLFSATETARNFH